MRLQMYFKGKNAWSYQVYVSIIVFFFFFAKHVDHPDFIHGNLPFRIHCINGL